MNKYSLNWETIGKLTGDLAEADRVYNLLLKGYTATSECYVGKWVYGTPLKAEYKFKRNPDNTFSIYRLS